MQPITLEIQVLLAQIAEARAYGQSWEQIATTVKLSVAEVRRLPFLYAEAWKKQLSATRRELVNVGVAQAVVALGAALQSDDLKTKTQAALVMSRIYQTQSRNEDRALKVKLAKQYDAETKPAKSEAKNTDPATTKPRVAVPTPPPERANVNTPTAQPAPKHETIQVPPKVKSTSPPHRDSNGFRFL
jgi:hypothetical protein